MKIYASELVAMKSDSLFSPEADWRFSITHIGKHRLLGVHADEISIYYNKNSGRKCKLLQK